MADDNRSYRNNDPYRRPAPERPRSERESDPLAELARLIGQNDPFADTARSEPPLAHQPQTHAPRSPRSHPPHDPYRDQAQHEEPVRPAPAWQGRGGAAPSRPIPQFPLKRPPSAPLVDRQHGAAHYQQPAHDPRYQPRQAASIPPRPRHDAGYPAQASHDPHGGHGYADEAPDAAPYESQGYDQYRDPREAHDHRDHHHYRQHDAHEAESYERAGPPRQRGRLTAALSIVALILIGTAGAFGYRAIFSGPDSNTPPVIKAETGPTKIVPATSGGESGSGKLIYDRVGDAKQIERIINREEQPVDVKDATRNAPRVVLPNPAAPNATASAGTIATASSPNISTEPKKIRTLTIRPDQAGTDTGNRMTAAAPVSQPRSAAPLPETTEAQPTAATRPAANRAPIWPQGSPSQSTGPISLAPPATTPAVPNPQPSTMMRTASVPAAGGDSGVYVQISSQRSEADAQASYRTLQARYPDVLGSREAVIRRADLGDKGVYYRAQIGPFASAADASEFCGTLKAAGGSCHIQRN